MRDIPIPGSGSGGEWPEAARRKGTRAMQAKYRRLREEAYEEGLAAREPDFRDFVCLYIAEGYKRDADQSPLDLARFWATELRVDSGIIRNAPEVNSSQLAGRKWRCRFGVLTVRCGDTLLRARLEAWMDRIKASWG